MTRFKGCIEAIKGGGHYVVIPVDVAEKAGLVYGMRVRGTVAGVSHRSSLMKYGGIFHMGVHKATLEKAKIVAGQIVSFAIEEDKEPLPADTVPEILAEALAKNRAAKEAFARLAPSHRREHVRYIGEAKRAETQAARVDKTLAMLLAPKPKPKSKLKPKLKSKPKR